MKVLKKLKYTKQIGWSEVSTLRTDLEWFFENLIGFNRETSKMYTLSAISYLIELEPQDLHTCLSYTRKKSGDKYLVEVLYNEGVISLDDLFSIRNDLYDFYSSCIGFNEKKSDYWANATVGYLANIDSLYDATSPLLTVSTPRLQ